MRVERKGEIVRGGRGRDMNFYAGRGKRIFFLIGKCGDKITKLMK